MTRSRRIGALMALATVGLVAAACGSDNSGSSSNTTAAPATTAAAAGASTTAAAGGATTTAAAGNLLKYDESAQCGTKGYSGESAKIEAVDNLTVKFTLCNPDVAFPAKVAFASNGIQSAAYLEKTGGGGDLITNPVGTGPYKLQKWDRGNQVVLARNDNYWGDKAKDKTLVFQWNTEAAQRLVQLQSGAADGIDNVGTTDFDTVKNDGNLQLVNRPATNVFYIGFNVDMKPFGNPASARSCLALA